MDLRSVLGLNPNEKELLSSHGFSDNQLCLWKYPTMNKITELRGHSTCTHLAMGPRADIVCWCRRDLEVWNVLVVDLVLSRRRVARR